MFYLATQLRILPPPRRLLKVLVGSALIVMLSTIIGCGSDDPVTPTTPNELAPDSQKSWTWLHPRPSGNTVFRYWGDGDEPVIRWTSLGAERRVDDHWLVDPELPQIQPLCIHSLTDMWFAYCESGDVMHFDGVEVTYYRPLGFASKKSSPWIRGVWGRGSDLVFVAASNGIFRYDGQEWTQVSNSSVPDIWGIRATDVYTVEGNAIRHFDGTTWTDAASFDGCDFYHIHGYSSNEIYAMDPHGIVAYYDGEDWLTLPPIPVSEGTHLFHLCASSPSDIIVYSGSGNVFWYSGTSWQQLASADDDLPYLYSPWTDRSGLYVIGGGYGTTVTVAAGQLSHDLEMDIPPVEGHSVPPCLHGVWASAQNDIYVSAGGIQSWGSASAVWHYDGTRWTQADLGDDEIAINDIHGCGTTAFAVGDAGALYSNTSGTWSQLDSDAEEDLLTVVCVTEDDVFVGGEDGLFIHLQGGEPERLDPPHEGAAIVDLCAISNTEVLAIIDQSSVDCFDGQSWRLTFSFAEPQYGLRFGEAQDGSAYLIIRSTVFVWQGSNWSQLPVVSPEPLQDCAVDHKGVLFGVGYSGLRIRFDGETWLEEDEVTLRDLRSISVTPAGEFVAVGSYGTVLMLGRE